MNSTSSNKTILRLIDRDGWNCHYCGLVVEPSLSGWHPNGWSIDHVIPISAGGSSKISNLVLSCRKCNLRKRTRNYHDFKLECETDAILMFLMEAEEVQS